MNENLAKILDEMAIEYRADKWRKKAYMDAANVIRRHDKKITSGKEAKKLPGIGSSIATKIDEILKSGTLKQLEARSEEEKRRSEAIAAFSKIYNVGTKKAEEWYSQGFKTLESLSGNNKTKGADMTTAQQLYYEHYDDLQKKIPRSEMEDIENALKRYWKYLDVTFMITGSYRREERESSDIDIVVRDGITMDELLEPIKGRFIKGSLTKGKKKFNGIAQYDEESPYRRIDILLVNDSEWPFALLGFTGNKDLNLRLRLHAKKMGYTLSNEALIDPQGNKVPAYSERDIFNILGVKYLEPWERKGNFALEEVPQSLISKISISEQKQQKEQGKERSKEWYRPYENLFVFISKNYVNGGNIASFDLDGTLVKPEYGDFPKHFEDVHVMPKRKEILQFYVEKNYSIVIFTNQKSTTANKLMNNYKKINYAISLFEQMGIPLILMMATGEDKYRKPNVGMWKFLEKMLGPSNIVKAFYCGDAAGRPGDFATSDREFANSLGIPFYTPEQIFF